MGFLDSLGDTVKKFGKAMVSGPGVVYDIATYVAPGDQWGDGDNRGFGGLLSSLGGRANDLTFVVPQPIKSAAGDTMHALNTAYHEAIDQPLSTAMIMASHIDTGKGETHYGDLFSADAWSQAYGIAEKQSFGQSAVFAFKGGDKDPFDVTPEATPFSDMAFTKDHPFLANASAFGADITVSWFLDPAVLAGKTAGVARQDFVLGRIPDAAKPNFAARLDGSIQGADKTFGVAQNWSGRFEGFFSYINGQNKLGRPLNAAEIRASSVELQKSSGGLAISSALEDALKLSDEADRANAARRVFAVAAGDTTQIARLESEVAGTKSLADKLRNIVNQKTVDLQAQALNAARKDSPEFRAAFDRQLSNLDETGDLSKFIKDWHAKVDTQYNGLASLRSTERSLDHLPGVHSGPLGSNHKLAVGRGTDALSKVEKAHDAVVAKLTSLPKRDSYTNVYQRGLSSVPVMAVYPAKFMAALLPTKAAPAIVRGLRTVHFNGVVNLHDWDAASDQLNSMMIHAGVENNTRLKQLSEVYGARNEADRLSVIHRTEQVAVDGVVRQVAAKHGLDETAARDFVQQIVVNGQQGRGGMLSAMNGSRLYSTTDMSAGMAARSRSVANARTQAAWDTKRAAEMEKRGIDIGDTSPNLLDENWTPRVDQFIDSSGVPFAMPVVSSQLANRVPLLDIHLLKQAAGDKAFAERLNRHAEAWRDASIEMSGLQAKLARANGSAAVRLQRRIDNARKVQDALLTSATFLNRWWKVGVLFRLGYPMRVLADDHMRIAARLGYVSFLAANVPEGIKNSYYNHLPGFAAGTRRSAAKADFAIAKAKRQQVVAHFGRDKAHSDDEWAELQVAVKAHLNGGGTPEQIARMRELDPDGRVVEWVDLTKQATRLRASVATRTRNLAKMREEGADAGKQNAAQTALLEAEGALSHVTEQLAGRFDPAELRSQIKQYDAALGLGPKNYRAPKRHIGESDVDLGDGNTVGGAFAVQGYHEATSSSHAFNYLLTDGEEMGTRLNQAGHWRSVAPGEPGYYQLWANVLNHQFQHSPEFMSIVRGEAKTPQGFASWLSKPEQAHLRERMTFYAHDAQDWGGRLLAMAEDYTGGSDERLLELMRKGRVSARQLERLFPKGDQRLPHLHGQLADVQSGRAGASRMFADGVQRAFGVISEMPTDRLSRHPFFNAVYKREVKAAYRVHVAEKGGSAFTDADRQVIENLARRKALKELKLTLWDISAHSHAANTMRFLSPFFAAHQEALNRWWNIAKDDPSVARHFQMFFDNIRNTGLAYNDDTGEAVMPGEGIGGAGNKIMLKVPWADDNNAVNKWLLAHGGGKYWSVNENGLNLILQNGILNPGVGPLVTIPVEELVRRYPEATEFEKVARALNQYPPAADNFKDLVAGQALPAWSKRMVSYFQGEKSEEFGRYYMTNFADNLTTFRLQYDREPTELELKKIQDKANKETHTDLVLMALSNATSITPAKPMSKYAVVQNGLQKLYEQMRTEGHDMEWLRSNFRSQYGDAYMAMIYSMGSNPAHLQGSVGEVKAIKKHGYLAKHIDPSLIRMAIGPEVDESDKAEQLYSSSAASWLKSQETGTPGENFRGKKDPRDVATSLVVSQGWDMYDEMVNSLDVLADQQGLSGYEQSPQLVEAKRRGLDYIKSQNPVFAHSYDSYTQKSFDKLVDDMRLIASNRTLAKDPTRSDVYWLSQYIQMRDMVQATLKQRAATGGDKTIGAKANADLARAFSNGLSYINSQSPYFKQFSYPVIERDPLLVTGASSG
jgi:hypothetical protein